MCSVTMTISHMILLLQTDAGQNSNHQRTYQTYIKSSIRCAVQGVKSAEQRYQDVPFYFDNLRE